MEVLKSQMRVVQNIIGSINQFVTFQTSNKYILKNESNKNSILNEKDATDLPNYKGGFGIFYFKLEAIPYGYNEWTSIWLLNLDSNLNTGLEIDLLEYMSEYWGKNINFQLMIGVIKPMHLEQIHQKHYMVLILMGQLNTIKVTLQILKQQVHNLIYH